MPRICFRCQKSHNDVKAFLIECSDCHKAWHHTCAIPQVSDEELIRRIKATNSNDVDNGLDGWVCRKCTRKGTGGKPAGPGPSKPIVVAESSKASGSMSRVGESEAPANHVDKGHHVTVKQDPEREDVARFSKILPLPKPRPTPAIGPVSPPVTVSKRIVGSGRDTYVTGSPRIAHSTPRRETGSVPQPELKRESSPIETVYGPPSGDLPSLLDHEMSTGASVPDDLHDMPMDVDDAPAMTESINQGLSGKPAPPLVTVDSRFRPSFSPPTDDDDDDDLYGDPSKSTAHPNNKPDVSAASSGLSDTRDEVQSHESPSRRAHITLSLTNRLAPALIQTRHADVWNLAMLPKERSLSRGSKIKSKARTKHDRDRTTTMFDFTVSEWVQQRGAAGKLQ